MTIAVKASFEIGTSGSLVLVPPRPIEPIEPALQFTGDGAPTKAHVDVLFEGVVHAPGPSTGVRARFAVLRAGQPRLDRQLYVYGERREDGSFWPVRTMPLSFARAYGGPGSNLNPEGTMHPTTIDAMRSERPACLSVVPPTWPQRAGQLSAGAISRQGDVLVLSNPFPWAYFQQAPIEQQLDGLEPTDRFVLEQLSARSQTLSFSLVVEVPTVQARGSALALRLDTVKVDGEASIVSLVWRGVLRSVPLDETVEVLVAYKEALAAASTAAVDPSSLGVPIAPFLMKAKQAAQAAVPAPIEATSTGAVDPKAIDAPIAPFLLRQPGKAASAAPAVAPPVAEAPAMLPVAPLPPATPEPPAPRPVPPSAEPTPPPQPKAVEVVSVEERLRRSGAGDQALGLLASAFQKKAPPPDEA